MKVDKSRALTVTGRSLAQTGAPALASLGTQATFVRKRKPHRREQTGIVTDQEAFPDFADLVASCRAASATVDGLAPERRSGRRGGGPAGGSSNAEPTICPPRLTCAPQRVALPAPRDEATEYRLPRLKT